MSRAKGRPEAVPRFKGGAWLWRAAVAVADVKVLSLLPPSLIIIEKKHPALKSTPEPQPEGGWGASGGRNFRRT